MRWVQRVIWAGGLIGVVGCAACGGELARPVAGEPARTAKVSRGEVVDRELITGELRSANSISLTVPRTETFQQTIRWLAEDGAMVKAGDKVVEFDNSAVTAQLAEKHLLVLEAAMTLRATQDLLAIEAAAKKTELDQRKIALDKAAVRAAVPAELLAGRESQERQLAKKRAEVAVAKAEHELESARKQAALELRIKQIDHDKAKRAIEAAEKTITDLVLHAPRDGLIVIEDHPWGLGRKIRVGDTVHPGATVASVPDLSQPMVVHAELSDVDDGRVAVGMSGTCTLDAYPGDAVPCTVKDMTPVARSKGESSLRRTFAVVLQLATTDAARMRPGMSVKVELPARRLASAIVVPRGVILPAAPGVASSAAGNAASAAAKSAARGGAPGTVKSAAPEAGIGAALGTARSAKAAQVRMASGELRAVTLGVCGGQVCAIESGVAEGDVVMLGGTP
jgi:multidrug efflux pump subunit AcrA (membrane-fusion protein)